MATALVETARELPTEQDAVTESTMAVRFKVSGTEAFELELETATAVRDV
eukprot:CAMPEP_0176058348 /NCGR_PEP_ID=MMETSP0120_2-20121206/29070_1 /TAXON_ID=160619 /ORGANISM="Kryptoperidinium foliaceum, Strain CCMP 1326" /LENGTH=49 /DNA_ID= /DNA_START= /DNA_END= /DNA_ORIENTATION=